MPAHMTGRTVSGDPVSLFVDGRRMGLGTDLRYIPVAAVKIIACPERVDGPPLRHAAQASKIRR